MKGTAKEYGLEVDKRIDERYHPVKSTEVACRYLNRAYKKFGSWTLVAASYNRGVRGMSNALEHQKAESYYELMLNEETYRYVFRILAIKQIFNDPSAYGFDIKEEHLYEPYQYIYDTIKTDLKLVDYAKSKKIDYKTLKIYNPWLRDDEIKVGRNNTYVFYLPSKK
jgi:membrane-bound lytic murein transglycosylase D